MDTLIPNLLAAVDIASIGTTIFNGLLVILGLGLVVFFHELGHFAVAKWCNVHVERFSIGFGPILWSRQKGETEYALSAFPFGGYVKMLGQDDMDANQMTSDEIAENPRAYSAKTVPQRMAIISAGVIMNVVTGFLFFVICYYLGVEEPSPLVGSVMPGSPAWTAGMRPGDRIESINGEKIQNFSDILNSVILSSGDLRFQGTHADGKAFDEVITPERIEKTRSVGLIPSLTAQLSPDIVDDDIKAIAMQGLPSQKANGEFLPGDQVIAVQGEPITSFSQLSYLTAKYASEDLVYEMERHTGKSSGDSDSVSTVKITIPPAPIKSIGLWMSMGPVKAIRKGSIAEEQGLQVGDRIVKVDGIAPGTEMDPLRLPVYFAERAGGEVKVVVNRQTVAGDQEVELTLTPDESPGWLERPLRQTAPLPIPSIGAAFQVIPRIAHVVPDSEAGRSGVFHEGQKVTSIELLHADPENFKPDAFGKTSKPQVISLTELEKRNPGTIEDINWAYAFVDIQQVPDRQVKIVVQDGEKNVDFILKEHETESDWNLWIRGINGWKSASDLKKATSLGEALSMGLHRTKSTGISIYMTLQSLIFGNLPADSISGPLGIVSIGTKVASKGLIELMVFLGFLSINLAIINFLPSPVLDGGHMVFLIWEGVARRKPNA
ncbi:MAG: RIP metalloprotease RseP, partial [Planctomycetaceae bacterium]